LISGLSVTGHAQWLTQTIPLSAGWNAVFLEVEPYPAQCDNQLSGLPIASVATFDQRFSAAQFVRDPTELTPDLPEWRFYYPPNDPRNFVNNLFILEAGKAYMVEAKEAFDWTVFGRPRLVRQAWKPGEYNFTGFYLDPATPPTMSAWFESSPAHSPLEIWTLSGGTAWTRVLTPSSTLLQPGKAYWVFCRGKSDFQGPVEISLTQGVELAYERSLLEREIEIRRLGSGARTVTVSPVSSMLPPDATLPILGGGVPLEYYGASVSGEMTTFGYLDLPANLSFASGDTLAQRLRVAVDRTKMEPAPADALYQSLLEIKDGQGFRRFLSVTSRGGAVRSVAKGRLKTAAGPDPAAGLWVGNIILNRVTDANQEPPAPTETAGDFEFRCIIHVDEDGNARLLNDVVQLWRPGTTRPDPENQEVDEVVVPGRYILLTPMAPEALLNELGDTVEANTLRDGRPFATRISTPAYSLYDVDGQPEEPVMQRTGAFGVADGRVEVTLLLEDSDPTNPFHHRYHHQHRYPDPGENAPDWTISWKMVFTFTQDPPDGLDLPGWGDREVGGLYRQELEGLASDVIAAEGVFRLRRASTVALLNDGLGG